MSHTAFLYHRLYDLQCRDHIYPTASNKLVRQALMDKDILNPEAMPGACGEATGFAGIDVGVWGCGGRKQGCLLQGKSGERLPSVPLSAYKAPSQPTPPPGSRARGSAFGQPSPNARNASRLALHTTIWY